MKNFIKFYTTVFVLALIVSGFIGGMASLLPFILTFAGVLVLPVLVGYLCYKIMVSNKMISTAVNGGK